jgi:acyl carrier protein
MDKSSTIASIRDVMLDVFDVDQLDVNEYTTADDVEDWDSLSHVRLIVAVERKFKIRFSSIEVESLKNVGGLADVVAAKAGWL